MNASETILVGKAEEVVYHTPFEPSGSARCWAQFRLGVVEGGRAK